VVYVYSEKKDRYILGLFRRGKKRWGRRRKASSSSSSSSSPTPPFPPPLNTQNKPPKDLAIYSIHPPACFNEAAGRGDKPNQGR
jgi:hypothetical protein